MAPSASSASATWAATWRRASSPPATPSTARSATASARSGSSTRACAGAGTPREVAEAADVVFTLASRRRARSSPWRPGADGILAGLDDRQGLGRHEHVSPRASRELAARVRERGAEMLDAPVSGSVPQVQGGNAHDHGRRRRGRVCARRADPARARRRRRASATTGRGSSLKLAINISLAVQMLAFSEGLLLAERDGIDPHLAAKVMTDSAIGSPMLKARVPLVLDLPDEAWFDIGLMHKDVRLALATARELDVPLPSAGSRRRAAVTRDGARLRAPRHRRDASRCSTASQHERPRPADAPDA